VGYKVKVGIIFQLKRVVNNFFVSAGQLDYYCFSGLITSGAFELDIKDCQLKPGEINLEIDHRLIKTNFSEFILI